MLVIVLLILFVIFSVIGTVIFVKARQDEVSGYYDAARNILKGDKLDSMLKNGGKDNSTMNGNIKPMVYLKMKGNKKCKFVFDPEKIVNIGRDKAANHVCINEAVVSHNHCRIFSSGMNVFLQDMGALNATEVKRGRRIYTLSGGETMELYTKDVVKIGTTRIEVVVFYFDLMMM